MSAKHLGDPAYGRSHHSLGQEVVVVEGLGAGSFLIQARDVGSARHDLEETVVSDGANAIERTLDLR